MVVIDNTVLPLSTVGDAVFSYVGIGVLLIVGGALLHGIDKYEDGAETWESRAYKWLGMFGGVLIAVNVVSPALGSMTPLSLASSLAFSILVVISTTKLMEYAVPVGFRAGNSLLERMEGVSSHSNEDVIVSEVSDD